MATIHTVHAVVRNAPGISEARARATMAAVREAVLPATSAEDFLARASAIPRADLPFVAQPVRDIVADSDHLDPDYVAAAFALKSIGDTSPITESSFGWHVIRLVERVPLSPSDVDRRRAELRDVIPTLRARQRIGSLLEAGHERTRIEITPGAQDLMAQVASAQP
jgi:peptidyl-prolyl cis-trans isomerase C